MFEKSQPHFEAGTFFDGGAVCVVTLTGGAFGLVVYIA